nr:MAG TPA: hypothetical protein [Caudoviricetes sp.]
MKKNITVKEMGAIVNAFKLSEDEQYFLQNIIDSINREKMNVCHYITDILSDGPLVANERSAVNALVLYFAAKTQTIYGWRKLDRITLDFSALLKCDAYQLYRWLFGLLFTQDLLGRCLTMSNINRLNDVKIAI